MAEPPPVVLVGVHGGEWFGAAAGQALYAATVLIGAPRHLSALPTDLPGQHVTLTGSLGATLERAATDRDHGERVCLVVSGDPGFFGLVRLARGRFGSGGLTVHPAPSSVALAFARAGQAWDDATVVSAHGRPLDPAVDAVLAYRKVAVLTSPEHPPQRLGQRLSERGVVVRDVAVASALGEAAESVWTGDVAGLAAGEFDPLSVVLCVTPDGGADERGWAWGRPDETYQHRDGMITKAEVRAIALGKLRLPAAGVLWDIGAGSGSVAAECARLAPGLRVFAVERHPDDVERLRTNLATTGAVVVAGEAPAALDELPDPDRVFVGGGGLAALDVAMARLRPGGTVVATYAAVDRAAAAGARLGNLVQVAVSRGVPIGPGPGLRLAADNPVFMCWGPEA
ncbi:MAG TPA: precorrin-6y C5,15-methyltransferase (decarboxylating) subunit CbiE [Acidimicrobiales bacterium]